MNRTKYLLITAFFIFSTSLFAQNDFREAGLSVGDNFNLAFVYKQQKAENRYISYDLLFARFGLISNSSNELSTVSLGLAVTFEKRKDIAEKVQFIHGWSPELSVGLASGGDNSTLVTLGPALGYRLGFLYQFSDQFYASIQGRVLGRVNIALSNGDASTSTNAQIGFSQEDVRLNFVYRFRKKN